MSKYQVLVDSSVWIDYFKNGSHNKLEQLIIEDLACVNEIILTELIPTLKKLNQSEVIDSLEALEKIPLRIDWNIIRKYQFMNLQNGINKVGIPDLLILQQVIDQKLTLYTFDKHFKLMQSNLQFDILE